MLSTGASTINGEDMFISPKDVVGYVSALLGDPASLVGG